MNFLTSGHGGLKPTLWVILMSETPSNYTLRQDIVFCTHTCCQQLWRRKKNEFKLVDLKSRWNRLTSVCIPIEIILTDERKGKCILPFRLQVTLRDQSYDDFDSQRLKTHMIAPHSWFQRTQGKKQRLDLTKRLEIGWLIGHRDRNSNMEKDMKIRVNKNTVLYTCKYNKSYQNKYHTLIIYQSGIFMNC